MGCNIIEQVSVRKLLDGRFFSFHPIKEDTDGRKNKFMISVMIYWNTFSSKIKVHFTVFNL